MTGAFRRISGSVQGALALLIVGLAASGGVGVFVVAKRAHAVTVDDALARFRAVSGATSGAVGSAAAAEPIDVSAAAGTTAAPVGSAVSADPAGVAGSTTQALAGSGGRAAARKQSPAETPGGSSAVSRQATVPTPRNGVYTYATTGGEQVSVLGGAAHTYPATTTIAVTGSGCSQLARWQPLQERYDDLSLCAVGQGVRATSHTSYHEFFGQSDKKVYACDPATMLRPDSREVGASATGTCAGSGAKVVVNTRIVGVETVSVGGTDVPAAKVHGDEVLTGATRGTRTTDSWYALSDNVLLRRTASADADSESAVGETHYTERYEIRLTSLTPRT